MGETVFDLLDGHRHIIPARLLARIESAHARELQSEKARADAADSRLAALEAGMRGLEAKWRASADKALRRSGTWDGDDVADRIEYCADELSALLNRPADGGE